MKPNSKFKKGNPYIPSWIEKLNLNDSQMRVLIHLWSRGNPCYPSGETIAKCLKKSEDTVWRILRKLETDGLLIRSKRKTKGIHNSNEYTLINLEEKFKNEHPTNTPSLAANESCNAGGANVHNLKVQGEAAEQSCQDFESESPAPSSDSKLMPDGMIDNEMIALPDRKTALDWAMAYYGRWEHCSEKYVGILKRIEIPGLVDRWFENSAITNGMHNGSPIAKPRLALECYLEKAALRQSKRCDELKDDD